MIRKKVLFVASIHKHFRAFHIPYIEYLQSQGYEVHVAANDGQTKVPEADKQYTISVERTPFSIKNIKAILELKKIIAEEHYTLVHCHTAMGSVVARLAAEKARKNHDTKVLYTAHGFHFYKGSPKSYWLVYYPMEKLLSNLTDAIITINKEDYNLLSTAKFGNKASYLIPGIGVETNKFSSISNNLKAELRKKEGLSMNDFVLVYAGEYIKRKNHQFLVEAVKEGLQSIPNLKLLLAGRGQMFEEIKALIKDNQLEGQIKQLGFRTDIADVYRMSDVGVSTSKQEGLGLNLIEEMMCGLPVVATMDRGHKEVIDHGECGFIFDQGDKEAFLNYLSLLQKNKKLYNEMSKAAQEKAQRFSLNNALKAMASIYERYL